MRGSFILKSRTYPERRKPCCSWIKCSVARHISLVARTSHSDPDTQTSPLSKPAATQSQTPVTKTSYRAPRTEWKKSRVKTNCRLMERQSFRTCLFTAWQYKVIRLMLRCVILRSNKACLQHDELPGGSIHLRWYSRAPKVSDLANFDILSS